MVIKSTGKPDIVTLQDVVSVARPIERMTAGETEIAKLEKYIVLADKGISLLGRAEGIIGPLIEKYGGQKTTTTSEPVRIARENEIPPGEGGNINKESGNAPPATGNIPPPGPPPAPVPGINAMSIAKVLRMIDGQCEGITALQMAELIEKNPDEVGRVMTAAIQSGVKI